MAKSSKELSAYSNRQAINQVLGTLMKDPSLIRKYNIGPQDFPERFHRIIFGAINNLGESGAASIGLNDLDDYLSHYNAQYCTFNQNNGVNYMDHCLEVSEPENIQYYAEQLKKFSLLRSYVEHGIDVSDFFSLTDDVDEMEEKRAKLDKASITDIINHFRGIQLEVTSPFRKQESRDSKKAGEGGEEQKELWKKKVGWGVGYSSAYLTTIFHGMRPKMYTIKSAGTGVGKTRTALADIAYACAPYYYDSKQGTWARNPNGSNNGALYIGTEMELLEEIDPILWAYIADVPQDHIKYNEYEADEEERVDRAIKMLQNDANIWLEYIPEYNVSMLEDVIEEHVLKHGVQYVFFDYIHTTTSLISEFQSRAKAKMAVREDQILLELSGRLKQMARDYDISLNTATQVNGNFKDEATRDQTLISGSKAVVNKADNALIAMPPTTRELSLIEPILDKGIGNGYRPNLVYSVYKVRDSQWNHVKVWLHVDYSTMRTHDLFVTDYDYQLIPAIQTSYIDIEGEEVASNKKPFYEISKTEEPNMILDFEEMPF